MKCSCCNVTLSDFEATMRHAETDEFIDTCSECLAEILIEAAIPIKDNRDLLLYPHHSDEESEHMGYYDLP